MVAKITVKNARMGIFLQIDGLVIMKRILCALCGMFLTCSAYAVPAVVDYIVDGDTFSAQVFLEPTVKITVRVRLINIDTPEMNGKCRREKDLAQRAKNRLGELIPRGTVVELGNIKDDKYLGRIDANVILPDGRDVATILIKQGLGRLYKGGKRQTWCK